MSHVHVVFIRLIRQIASLGHSILAQFFTTLKVWERNFWADLTGPYGYRVWVVGLTTIVGAYVGLYSLLEARHDRQMNRALFERNVFMTMVSSGNRGAFVAAMKRFGPVQTIRVPRTPPLLKPWDWWKTEQPNMNPLLQWARSRLSQCIGTDECGVRGGIDLIRADLQGANLHEVFLTGGSLIGANLQGANLQDANLLKTNLREANLRGAQLQRAQLSFAYLNGADLQGSNLQGADVHMTRFRDDDRSADVGEIEVTIEGRRANLQGANLESLENWTTGQFSSTTIYWDEYTKFPETLPCLRNLPDSPCETQG